MRRIRMFNQVSADGYFAAPDGGLGWVVPDERVQQAAVEAMPSTDTLLVGRRTYEMFAAFWPHALDDSATASDPHRSGAPSAAFREMALWLNRTPKLVFSRTLQEAAWGPARIVRELDPRSLAAMKQEPGGAMIVLGSGSIVAQLTEHGLIDEYELVVCPVLLGRGRSMVDNVSRVSRLTLAEATALPSGNVRLRYARAA